MNTAAAQVDGKHDLTRCKHTLSRLSRLLDVLQRLQWEREVRHWLAVEADMMTRHVQAPRERHLQSDSQHLDVATQKLHWHTRLLCW